MYGKNILFPIVSTLFLQCKKMNLNQILLLYKWILSKESLRSSIMIFQRVKHNLITENKEAFLKEIKIS
ncbi:hypothetical protein BAZ12_00015 [Elizabethkingia miricola]|uniref:Uncharacterized protein n=1 Tax=Elizabethkingia miricola TaxID=172045 RepID=A0ABD4DKT5_ELIMR|nr:hypothetical protein ATB95_13350 [Elizabethkingia miricola]OPC06692.1 hypothetical protein BAY01_18620 [Elizabethkingia miricola]OPC30695.1 hypothetical protein BAX98_08765 [Elizabethkingia anophelis]OPC68397.1 hypothetical protein BAZ13_13275 [Elizabethkingia miricola]OPC75470.1 hypothetical protein BAZ12_00015 [Elizabethkingia miricola]